MFFESDTREFYLYDDIGPGDAQTLHNALTVIGAGELSVRVNSYGGSVDEALAMVEILKRHQLAGNQVTVTVDAIAASAASLFPAEFTSFAAEHSRVMIHNPWGVAMGDANELRKTADVLDRYKESIVSIYSRAMNLEPVQVAELLDAETWYSAGEASAAGLVGSVAGLGDKPPVAAMLVRPDRFKKTPEDLVETEPASLETVLINATKQTGRVGTVTETPALAAARNKRIKTLFDMRRAGYEN